MSRRTKKIPLSWSLTNWEMNGKGGWKIQPVILVEGRRPFFADTPQEYISELERLHDDGALAKGTFHTLIGQLKDGLELSWNPGLMQLPEVPDMARGANGKESLSSN